MKLKNIYKILSLTSLVLFYMVLPLSLLVLLMNGLQVWKPLCCGLEEFDSVYTGYMDITFYGHPDLFTYQGFHLLTLVSHVSMFLLVLLFLWYMHKLLKNIHADSLFMYENVSIFFKMGITILVLGSFSTYIDGVLLAKTLAALEVSNAKITFSNLSYVDTAAIGIVLLVIAASLKTAVHAVEENKKTI